MSLPLYDPATGWHMTCLTDASGTRPPDGGLVLQGVRHWYHNFARDLRLIGIRIISEQVNGTRVSSRVPRFLPLSAPHFTVGPIQVLTPSVPSTPSGTTLRTLPARADAVHLRTYFAAGPHHAGYGLKVEYDMPRSVFDSYFGANCEVESLAISQVWLFSPYGNVPPHEPGGALMAARFHPITTFRFTPRASVDRSTTYTRIDSIRFDYRFQLYVDSTHITRGAALPASGTLQQAALFRDNESAAIGSAIGGALNPFSPTGSGASAGAFAAIEKPLVLEVVAPGLSGGLVGHLRGQHVARCWDNLHWWGFRGAGRPIISAPGAFHAAHCHWRWGAAANTTIPEIDTITTQPAAAAAGATRTLVDPDCWMQTIRVAVVKNEPSRDPSTSGVTLEGLSRIDWETLFTSLRASPLDIMNGEDLVYWYSTEVHRTVTIGTGAAAATFYARQSGRVFIHGFFFAHNPEITSLRPPVGSTGPEHWPNSAATIRSAGQWFRGAS